MSANFKDNIKKNTMAQDVVKKVVANEDSLVKQQNASNSKQENSIETKSDRIILVKKPDDKKGKKSFNVYMDPDLVKELDKIAKQSHYSRNELISMACKYYVSKVDIVDNK